MKMLVSLALLSAALITRAAEWDHYQVILDRHPFGALENINTNAIPDFAKSLRLSALWMAHGQFHAGFEDNTDKIKRDYVLSRGELSEEGIELVDVNVADESAVIRKGTETATLHVQAGASTNMPIVNVPGMPPGAGNTGNPWRDFYERYRQRHQQEGGGGQPPFPMPGGPGGGTFTMGSGGGGAFSVSGGAQGQPTIIMMQAPAASPGTTKASKYSGQSSKGVDSGTSDAGGAAVPRSSHKHGHSTLQ
ncbi:MAG: hypothetical protein NTY53_11125 [Kiritimatiellaeota bacterium]|nr:hypothetical protein [Kiritimatiellota bacterium]